MFHCIVFFSIHLMTFSSMGCLNISPILKQGSNRRSQCMKPCKRLNQNAIPMPCTLTHSYQSVFSFPLKCPNESTTHWAGKLWTNQVEPPENNLIQWSKATLWASKSAVTRSTRSPRGTVVTLARSSMDCLQKFQNGQQFVLREFQKTEALCFFH